MDSLGFFEDDLESFEEPSFGTFDDGLFDPFSGAFDDASLGFFEAFGVGFPVGFAFVEAWVDACRSRVQKKLFSRILKRNFHLLALLAASSVVDPVVSAAKIMG